MLIQYLFEVITYKWSDQAVTYGGNPYTAKVDPESFSGITERWDMGGQGLISPSEINFNFENKTGAITQAALEGEFCTVRLIIDGVQSKAWKYKIKSAVTSEGFTAVYGVDILQDCLTGSHPNTDHPREVWLSDNHEPVESDTYRIPVIFGEAYIPLMYVYNSLDTTGYYVLGADDTYTISEVKAPPESTTTTWTSGSYTFTQSTSGDYKIAEFDIAPDGIGGYDPGTWPSNLKPLVKYRKTAESAGADPATVIKNVLLDFGVASGDIDTASFTAATTAFATAGIEWDGGFYQSALRETVLNNLLAQCDSYLYVGESIELHPFSTTSQETFTAAKTVSGSFSTSRVNNQVSDGGLVTWVNPGDPQNTLTGMATVPTTPGATVENPDGTTFECKYISDSQVAQALGTLFFQRNLTAIDEISFNTTVVSMTSLDTLTPGKVITINDALFGGAQDILVTSLTIARNGVVDISGMRYGELDEFADLTIAAVSVETDATEPSFPLATDGDDGYNQATLYLYQRKSTAPAKTDIATQTYTFSTKTSTGSIGAWSKTIPAGTDPLYVTAAVASSTTATDEILNAEWSTPVILAQNGDVGDPGDSGLNSAVVSLYRRYATSPTKPTTNETYTFSTGVLTPINWSWTQEIPTIDGNPLWIITAMATATAPTDTDTISYTEWSTPVKILEDGTNGTDSRSVDLSITTQAFTYSTNGDTPSPTGPITLTATAHNTDGTVYYDFQVEEVTVQNTTSNTYSYTPQALYADMPELLEVDIREGTNSSAILAHDRMTAVGLIPGSPAVTPVFANVSHTVPASFAGVVSSYVGSGSTLQIYDGDVLLDFHTSIATGRFTVGTPVVSPTGKITVGGRSGSGTTTCTIAAHSAMDNATDLVTITYPISVRKYDGTNLSLDITQTITKSKVGNVGANGKTYALNITGGVRTFTWDTTGTSFDPTATALSSELREDGVVKTPTSYSWTTGGTGVGLISGSGSSATFTPTVTSTWSDTKGENWISLTVVYDGQTVKQTVPISCSKVGEQGDPGVNATNWTSTLVFSSTDYNTVAWATGNLYSAGATRSITGSNTGTMTALTYIYFDPDVSTTALQFTTTASTAFGTNKVVVCVAQNNADTGSDATFQVFGGGGGGLFTADNIAADTLTGNEIFGNVLSAIFANVGTVTSGILQNVAGTVSINLTTGIITITKDGGLVLDSGGGMTVENGGGVTVNEGGDIVLINETNANPAKVSWYDDTYTRSIFFKTYNAATLSYLQLTGDATTYQNLYLGTFQEVWAFADYQIGRNCNSSAVYDLMSSGGNYSVNATGTIDLIATGNIDVASDGDVTLDAGATDHVYLDINSTHYVDLTTAGMQVGTTINVDGDVVSQSDGVDSLGDATHAFDDLFIQTIQNPNATSIEIVDSLIPTVDGTIDIGSTTHALRVAYADHFQAVEGIRFGTDTAAVNTLDDYEEGEYTPTLTCGSGAITLNSSVNTLSYTKVGRKITVTGQINVSSTTGSGSLEISLPFAIGSLTEEAENAVGTLVYYAITALNSGETMIIFANTGSAAQIGIQTTSTTSWGATAELFVASSNMNISLTYFGAT